MALILGHFWPPRRIRGGAGRRLHLYFREGLFCDRVHRHGRAFGGRWATWSKANGNTEATRTQPDNRRTMMNTKQQCATGFLAMIIVASVALMPVNAEV